MIFHICFFRMMMLFGTQEITSRLCSANTFGRYFERVVERARVDFEDDLKDRDVSYVCFRVGLSNGNYVYSTYSLSGGAGGPRITIEGLSSRRQLLGNTGDQGML